MSTSKVYADKVAANELCNLITNAINLLEMLGAYCISDGITILGLGAKHFENYKTFIGFLIKKFPLSK